VVVSRRVRAPEVESAAVVEARAETAAASVLDASGYVVARRQATRRVQDHRPSRRGRHRGGQ
jgi:hypothetical protein